MANSSFTLNMNDNACATKRRRCVSSLHPTDIQPQSSECPLLLQMSGQAPSPQEIEAQLLQVGMRVRKPINDNNQNSKFNPRPFFNMHRLSPETQAALFGGESSVVQEVGPYSASRMNRQPISTATFCGINLSVMSSQPSSTPIQEQKMWAYSTSHKRGYEGDSDSDDQEYLPHTPTLGADDMALNIPVDYFAIDFESMSDESPFTQATQSSVRQFDGRRMAKMRSKRTGCATEAKVNVSNPFAHVSLPTVDQQHQRAAVPWTSQHRRMTSCGIEANTVMTMNEFGEATFLQRREDVDMDCS